MPELELEATVAILRQRLILLGLPERVREDIMTQTRIIAGLALAEAMNQVNKAVRARKPFTGVTSKTLDKIV